MNIELLKRYITDSPLSQEGIADEIGMKPATWYRRMKANNFTVNEFLAIAKVLKLSQDEIMKILQLNN